MSAKPKSKKARRQEIFENVFLYTSQTREPVESEAAGSPRSTGYATVFRYEIECAKLIKKGRKFSIDFRGSQNVKLVEGLESTNGSNLIAGLLSISVVKPFTRQTVAVLHVVDSHQKTSLKCKYTWKESENDDADANADPHVEVRETEHKNRCLRECRKIFGGYGSLGSSGTAESGDAFLLDGPAREIAKSCQASGVQFCDPDFPPIKDSLVRGPLNMATRLEAAQGASEALFDDTRWRTPSQFGEGLDYKMFEDGISPDDIRQGSLGDCWFLCAVSAIAEFPILVYQLFNAPSSVAPNTRASGNISEAEINEAVKLGVHRVRLCKNGQWQTVVLDNFFPCIKNGDILGGPIFSRSHGHELWVLVLEKAYAKLHGSYNQLRMGHCFEALMDLTGAPVLTVHLDDDVVKAPGGPTKLWGELMGWDLMGYLVTVSTAGEDTFTELGKTPSKEGSGLVAGHAYTLLASQQHDGVQLVKLRNPWGKFEWTGAWSDEDPRWTEQLKKKFGYSGDEDDGVFYMSFEDVLGHFSSINVCLVKHPDINGEMWFEERRKVCFQYHAGAAGNGPRLEGDDGAAANSLASLLEHGYCASCSGMLNLTVTKSTTVFITLIQDDERCVFAEPYLDMGLVILKCSKDHREWKLLKVVLTHRNNACLYKYVSTCTHPLL
jgi:hypothetical protein